MRAYLLSADQEASDVLAYSEEAKQHFQLPHSPDIPRPEMIAAVDWFFNAVTADIKVDTDKS
jgi:hypothetical protein